MAIKDDKERKDPEAMAALGLALRALRKSAGLTQGVAAELLYDVGLHQPDISNMEKGKRMASAGQLEQLLVVMGASPSQASQIRELARVAAQLMEG